jgi:hypothetical protein
MLSDGTDRVALTASDHSRDSGLQLIPLAFSDRFHRTHFFVESKINVSRPRCMQLELLDLDQRRTVA